MISLEKTAKQNKKLTKFNFNKQDEMKWDVNWMLELNKICRFIRVHQGLRKSMHSINVTNFYSRQCQKTKKKKL